ncbi:DUF1870 family protein [Kitasatospora sp. NPDC002551]|uniref:helix-turn-helix domain-containing protein n=1 Tax=Kitasatospora sp. NPDC002551 TaxID=3154539 RepID=UPI003329558B
MDGAKAALGREAGTAHTDTTADETGRSGAARPASGFGTTSPDDAGPPAAVGAPLPREATYTDPAFLPEDERMQPAELRVVREYLGLTGDWLAAHLQVSGRTVRAWEAGRHPIPDAVRLEVEALEQHTAEFVGAAAARLAGIDDPGVWTYRSDDEYHAAHPESFFPAAWHRAVVARIAYEVPGLRIAYPAPEQG